MLGRGRPLNKTLIFCQQALCGLSSQVTRVIAEITEKSINGDVWLDFRTLCKQGFWEKALQFLDTQRQQSHYAEAYKILLHECVGTQDLEGARKIHVHMESNNVDNVEELNRILFRLYVKCYDFEAAQRVFDMILQKDVDLWTLIIGGSSKTGHLEDALTLFWRMQNQGIMPNGVICVCILKACTAVTHLMIVHACIVSLGICLNVYIKSTLLHMYFKCGSVEDAMHIFSKLPNISEISWNTLIAGYVQHGFLEKAFEVFESMKLQGAKPDEITFLSIIKAGRYNFYLLKRLHVEIFHGGLESNCYVASALIDAYAGSGNMNYARKTFGAVLVRDAPVWNSLLFCFAEYGNAAEALSLYSEMEKHKILPDKVTFLSLLKACTLLRYLENGKRVHSQITVCGFDIREFIGSALVDMYVKCGNLEDARNVFDRMPKQDLVSWNTILAGYCDYEPATKAFHLFQRMRDSGVKPDKVTFLTILKACANVGAFEQSKYIYTCIYDSGLHADVFVGSALIDTFGKCGSVYHAHEVFKNMCKRDEVSWSALIAGYAQHGQAEEAFEIFTRMQSDGLAMDDVTFVGVLKACSHAGLVSKGCEYFDLMRNGLGIIPTGETCACMVDLLGRAGQIQEAVKFIKEMDTELSSSVWVTLLNASKLSGHVKLAERAYEKISALDPQCTSAFVMLSNIYVTGESACSLNLGISHP